MTVFVVYLNARILEDLMAAAFVLKLPVYIPDNGKHKRLETERADGKGRYWCSVLKWKMEIDQD